MYEKFRYLIKNTGLLMLGNFSSKVLVFFLVPLYTSVLTTEEYGYFDLLHTTVQMLVPILTLNIIDGVMRFSLDEQKKIQSEVFTIGLKFVVVSAIIVMIGTVIAGKFHVRLIIDYGIEFVLLYICYTVNQFVTQFARGIDDISGISIAGVIGTALMIAGNLLFLLIFKIGLHGYFYAYIISFFIPVLFLIVKDRMFIFFDMEAFRSRSAKEMEILRYCIPLIFTSLSWNINSVADRYIVTFICGVAVNGLYSVAYKIPAILNAIQVIFVQAWQLSAIREYGRKDGDEFYRKTYEACQTVMVVLCSVLIVLTKPVAHILYAKDFFTAWQYVPTLLLYIVFNTLSGTIGGVLSAVKDTKAFAQSAITGALVNIVLNIVLVYIWGAEGAAIATAFSSIVIWYMRLFFSKKYIEWNLNFKRHILEYILLILQVVIMSLVENTVGYIIQGIIIVFLLVENMTRVAPLIKKLLSRYC